MNRWQRRRLFRYYRVDGKPPFPRTLATALHAFRSGLLPLEPIIFHAGSTDSIYRQPLNIPLVLDLMSNADTDHAVNQAVAVVLFDNLGEKDQQTSDFAAQALVRMEERYYQRIQDAENTFSVISDDEDAAAALGELYLEFAELQRYNLMLRTFYLRKVIDIETDLFDPETKGCEDTRLPIYRVRALIGLGQLEQAEDELARTGLDETPEGIWLAADIAYANRDVERVKDLIAAALEAHWVLEIPLTRAQELAVDQWSRGV